MIISQKFLPKANKRRVIANAILIAPIFALLSACGGGDVPYADSLDAQAAEMEQVRPANYQVESVAEPASDANAPATADTANGAPALAGTATAGLEASQATNPATNQAAASTEEANPGATAAGTAADATAPAAAQTEVANANPAGTGAADGAAAAANAPGAAADNTGSKAPVTLTDNSQPVKTPVPATPGKAQ